MLGCPYAFQEPELRASLRHYPEDFRVEEELELDFSGEGEFEWVWVEKPLLTTPELATLLQQYSGAREVSYSGLKDKRAVTRQWFSLHLPGTASPDWSGFSHPQCRILSAHRHQRKLRRGSHRGNRFELLLRGVDQQALASRLETVVAAGVPNYFGEQRFGGQNLAEVRRWFAGGKRPSRFKRGLLLSVARAQLFNAVLARRVSEGTWNRALAGDLFVLGDSNSLFRGDDDSDLAQRLAAGDIQPTGPLAGRPGKLSPRAEAAALEQAVLDTEPRLCEGLKKTGVEAARRALRVYPKALRAEDVEGGLRLCFSLPKGCFATALVRELIVYSENAS